MGVSKALLPAVVAVVLVAGPAAAVTVVSCKDKDGSTYFADRCPPGAAKLGEKEVRSGPRRDGELALAEAVKRHPVVLYTVADCDACDLVRQQLTSRQVPFTEKDVGPDQIDNQQALKAAANGNMTVPTVAIGSETFSGYSRAALDQGLDAAGYPPRPVTPGPVGSEATAADDTGDTAADDDDAAQ